MGSRVISAVLTLQDRDFSSNIARAAARADDLGRGVAHVGNRIQSFGRSAKETFKTVATSAAKISLAGISTGIGVLGATVGNTVLEMDKAFSTMEAKTGATGESLAELENVAKNVFKAGFGESISEVANNVGTLKTMFSDLNESELTDLASGISTISELFDQDVKEVGKTIQTMTANFKELSDTQAMDLLTAAFQDTGDYADDLLDTFNEYAVHFAKLGLSGQEFAGILANATGAFNLDKVGDAVKEFGIRAIDGSETTKAGFEAIGLSADEMASKIAQGGESANNAFTATLAGLAAIEDPIERNAAGVNLFGTMWEDLRDDVVLSMADGKTAIQDFEGSTAKAAGTMHDNIKDRVVGAWRSLQVGLADMASSGEGKEFLDGLATTAENLVPKIQGLVEKAFEFGNTIRDNWTPIKETVIGIGAAVGTFAVVMGGLKVVSFITTLMQGFRTAMAAGSVAQWALNTAMLASPMTWIAAGIAAVVAVGVLLYRNWDTVKQKAVQLWNKINENPFAALLLKMNPIVAIAKTLYKNFDKIKESFNSFKKAISNFKLPGWVSSIGSTISGAASKVKDMLPSFDVGTNKVASDMTANIHKGEMIIPARQAERLRQQGVNINNIDKVKTGNGSGGNVTTTTVTNSNSNAKNNVNINIYSSGTTTAQVINEIVPQLKLALANI